MTRKSLLVVLIVLLLSSFVPGAIAQEINTGADSPAPVRYSHRLIVELSSPALAEASLVVPQAAGGGPDLSSPQAQEYLRTLAAEQQAFVASLGQSLPSARVATFRDENGAARSATYQLVMNAVAVDPGLGADVTAIERQLQALPGVRRVHRDYAHEPTLYASLPLINVSAAWDNPAIGGQAQAGAGIKLASVDGGVHKDAPMFNGAGYSYPPGYPKGDTRNTNGKIIVSRAYFRAWDPPSPGDENPWPGVQGTSHGVHTASIAAGNPVTASYLGITVPISGVAPKAYVMSYRVFYNSITNDGSFYNVEGIAALEDAVRDGADVINNSWGGGPSSLGGAFDALDLALINASRAGVFVSMSAGNAGPGGGTTDHPSDNYINVAATTTTGTYAAGRLQVPISPTLQSIPYSGASFGAPLPLGTVVGPYNYVPALAVNPANALGCAAFPAGAFTGKVALISRGTCEFGVKALNAQNAGAVMAIIYNNAGDSLITMGPGAVGNQVTIPALFIGQSYGGRLVTIYNQDPATATVQVNTVAFQVGNVPDVIASFSSRGPGVGNVGKPDIAAPGVNILAQGFAEGVTGEARHLGYGQASGTSMAAPHVAGAASLLQQIHPTWSPAWIKSALMSTSKYIGVYVDMARTIPAQPLDMGAGRLDLTKAADPGVILDPPSLSFGGVVSGTVATKYVNLTNVASTAETYTASTHDVSLGYDPVAPVAGMTVTPASVTLAPGQTAQLRVDWNPALAGDYGDRQGYLVLTGPSHSAHLPAWMRVAYETPTPADVLVIDNDFSDLVPASHGDYTGYYTRTLQALGLSYTVWNADELAGLQASIPDANVLSRYPTVIYQTGDHYQANGAFTIPTPPTGLDMDRLVEYVNGGGRIIAFGQDLAAATGGSGSNPPFFYSSVLGAKYLQDSVSAERVFTATTQSLVGLPGSPLADFNFDISARGDGADNQFYVDEIQVACKDPDSPENCAVYRPLLKYGEPATFVADGTVALSHSDEPTLERPGITFPGRALYFAFGLEGVNNNTGADTREELLGTAVNWGLDRPTVTITPDIAPPGQVTYLVAAVQSPVGATGVSYRWDFGDGSPFTETYPSATAGHTYARPGVYHVRVEATDSLGHKVIGQRTVVVSSFGAGSYILLPLIYR